MAETPVKTFTRLHLTPSTKQYVCIICGGNIQNVNYRMRLFHKETKTSHCHLLERHLNVAVSQQVCTDIVCRSCVRKLTSIDNKVSELKSMYDATLERLQATHGKKSKKRLSTDPDPSSKKTLFSPVSSVLQPRTDSQMVSYFRKHFCLPIK